MHLLTQVAVAKLVKQQRYQKKLNSNDIFHFWIWFCLEANSTTRIYTSMAAPQGTTTNSRRLPIWLSA